MSDWKPDLTDRDGPRYLVIAEAIAADIDSGRLAVGTRLPPHRELARGLGVNVGTVTRAYAEIERRGLVKGEVGRGTFVLETRDPSQTFYDAVGADGLLDLSQSVPSPCKRDEERALLAEAFATLSTRPDLTELTHFQPPAGGAAQRAAGAEYLRQLGCETTPERVLLTCGAQHAMFSAFASCTNPGDVVLTEELTFPGMKGLANLLHLQLRGVPMDEQGILPDAFEKLCRDLKPKALYLIPTLHNPTSLVMPLERRQRIADLAQQYAVTLVEDGVYAFLDENAPPPLAQLAPERTFFLTSISKLVAPGIRLGFLSAPAPAIDRAAAAIWSSAWMASQPLAEMVRTWIENGDLQRFVTWRRQETSARNRLAGEILQRGRFTGHPQGFHLWLALPEPWGAEDFVALARRQGVAVSGAGVFAVDRRETPHAVRVSLTEVASEDDLRRALQTLEGLFVGNPETHQFVA